MIIVTGGAGFIGSNLVIGLNRLGRKDILVVDDLTDSTKFKNIAASSILDYQDKEEFFSKIKHHSSLGEKVEAVFHQGACSVTTERDGAYMMHNNYEYSKLLLHYCLREHIPFIYASSAAVYGAGKNFQEEAPEITPLNIYGYSKLLFDHYVQRFLLDTTEQLVGLRYFNVYGPREQHKGEMASVIWHFNQQLLREGKIRLFKGSNGYADGEQLRDFVFVEDVVQVNLWFWQKGGSSGIYNVGSGRAESFNRVGEEILAWHGRGRIEYIPFPERLVGYYQSFTQADLSSLRQSGCPVEFRDIKSGIREYLDHINANK